MPDSAEPTDLDERAARRVLLFAAIALLAVLAGAVVVTVTKVVRDGSEPSSAVSRSAPASPTGVVEAIGPQSSAAIAAYVESRRGALAAASGTRLAVVSLDAYRLEVDARAAVGPRARVVALLVAAPGGASTIVEGDLDRWAAIARKDAIAERTGIAELLPTVDDPEFAAFYRAELVRLARLAVSARAGDAVVHGVVVRAPVTELRRISARRGVRLVDVGSGAVAAPGAIYVGLRPEEVVQAGSPELRP